MNPSLPPEVVKWLKAQAETKFAALPHDILRLIVCDAYFAGRESVLAELNAVKCGMTPMQAVRWISYAHDMYECIDISPAICGDCKTPIVYSEKEYVTTARRCLSCDNYYCESCLPDKRTICDNCHRESTMILSVSDISDTSDD